MLRVAIIGISGYAAIIVDLLRQSAARGDIAFTAATVINQDEERSRCQMLHAENVRLFADYREMLSACGSKIDLCIVPVGIPWHTSIAIDVLKAGCHVFLEKPMAGSYSDAAKIARIARSERRHLFVGFQDLSDPGVWAIKDALLAGAIGDVLEIRAAGAWPRPLGYFRRNGWAGKLTAHGVTVRDSPHNNALAHLVNLSLFWAGDQRVASGWPRQASGYLYRFLPIESFDTGWIQWDLDGGRRVVCAASHSSEHILAPRIHIQGTTGSLVWDYEHGLVDDHSPIASPPRPDLFALRELVLESAFQTLRGRQSHHCQIDNALAHAKAIELAHGVLPIRNHFTADVHIDHREDGEYRFISGIDQWCLSALQPELPPQPVEKLLREQAGLESAGLSS